MRNDMINKLVGHILISILIIISFQVGYTQDELAMQESLELSVGEFRSVKVDNPSRVSIDDPNIADIKNATAEEIFIEAKSEGITALRIWSEDVIKKVVSISVLSVDLNLLQKNITKLLQDNELLKNITVDIDKNAQKITLTGSIEPTQKEKFDKIVSAFQDRISNYVFVAPEKGLLEIDVQILELTEDAQKQLGFSWVDALQFREEPYGSTGESDSGVQTTLSKTSKFGTLFHVAEWSRDALHVRLGLLESEGKLRILSRPKLLCLSGKEAKFTVGGEVPIISTVITTGGAGGTSVEYKEYGIILNIQPTLDEATGDIRIVIKTEVSDVVLDTSKGAAQSSSTLIVPAFTKNIAQTELYLKDEQTIFIAGLIKNKTDEDMDKVPGLAQVPILGAFFRSKNKIGEDKELVISVTPKVVSKRESSSDIQGQGQTDTEDAYLGEIPTRMRSYIYSLRNLINRNTKYPSVAQNAGYEGVVGLGLHILSTGELKNVVVSQSSGSNLLDNAALEAVQSLHPFWPFPKDSGMKDVWIDVPIVFKLE